MRALYYQCETFIPHSQRVTVSPAGRAGDWTRITHGPLPSYDSMSWSKRRAELLEGYATQTVTSAPERTSECTCVAVSGKKKSHWSHAPAVSMESQAARQLPGAVSPCALNEAGCKHVPQTLTTMLVQEGAQLRLCVQFDHRHSLTLQHFTPQP